MRLLINGKEELVEKNDTVTVSDLLRLKNVKMPEMVSVELNGELLERTQFENTILKDNDKIEFLYYMGGGASEGR